MEMKKDNKNLQFKIDGLFKLKKVGDYLKLVDTKVSLICRERDTALNIKKISRAEVAALSETGTHLILKNVYVKKYIFFYRRIEKYSVPLQNIVSIQILDRNGEID